MKFPILSTAILLATSFTLQAGSIVVPNFSFELPTTSFVTFGAIDIWEKTPKPEGYDEGGGSFQWYQLTGIFKNGPVTASDHIHNCEGAQALWIFVVPGAGLFQDNFSTNGLDATFEPGKSYTLTTGFIGGGGGMKQGATVEASLYYRDAASNFVTVAAKTITHSVATFPDKTNLVDQSVFLPVVRHDDPWAGQQIGIKFVSTVSETETNLHGGYWDLDNVRLTSVLEPTLTGTAPTNGQFIVAMQSEPGLTLELQFTTNLLSHSWTTLQTVTNSTGDTNFIFDAGTTQQVFYRTRRFP